MDSYLITGGAGFIGSNIAQELVDAGCRVRVLDDFSTGRSQNLDAFKDRLSIVEGSVVDPETVHNALAGVDYVIHLAAIPSVQRSMEEPLASDRANAAGTLNLYEQARRLGTVKRIVLASSSSVYGESPTLPKQEDMTPCPLSVYGGSKLTGEVYAHVYRKNYNLPVICLRYFNVFGRRQNPNSQYAAVIPNFIKSVLAGKSPVIYGDGEQTRDFTYVKNVVAANIAACKCELPEDYIFNIACGERTSLLELYRIIAGLAGFDGQPLHEPERIGDIKHSLADVTRAKTQLGFTPEWSLADGLKETFDWFKDNMEFFN